MAYFISAFKRALQLLSAVLILTVGSIAFAGVNTWTGPWPRNQNLQDMQAVSSTGKILAVGFGRADMLLTSLDGGISWSPELAVSIASNNPSALGVDVQNPNFIWIADATFSTLYRSTDGGKTFTMSRGYGVVNSINVRGSTVFLGTSDGVYRSVDRGVTFTRTAQLSGRVQAITSTDANTVYAALSTGVQRSVNGGVTFTPTGLINVNVSNVRAAPDGTIYAVSGQNLYVSQDQGNSWGISVPATKVTLGEPSSLAGLNIAPDNTVILTINGAIAKSADRGNTWAVTNAPFSVNSAIVSVAQEAANPATVYALSQRTDLLKSIDGGKQWVKINNTCVGGGCGAYAVRHFYVQNPILFMGANTLKYSTNGGVTFTESTFVGGAVPVYDIVQAAPNSPTFYATTRVGMYKSTNSGATWVKASNGLPANSLPDGLAVDTQNPNIAYVGLSSIPGTTARALYKTVDGGNNWSGAGLPLTTLVTSVKALAGKVYVTTYGSGLFYSDNAGQTWSSRNVGTTTANLNRIIADSTKPTTMFLAGDKGLVYQSIDAAATWFPINYRMPIVDIADLIISPDGKTLHLGTDISSGNASSGGYYQYTISNPVVGATTDVYRLYSPILLVHFYTADANEYRVLSTGPNWIGEGKIYTALSQPGSINSVATVPMYRLYSPLLLRHLLTTDFNEYTVLGGRGWIPEGIAWYMVPQTTELTIPIYRLYNEALRRHLYTVDENEKNVLSNGGWYFEGVVGYVLRPN